MALNRNRYKPFIM